MSTSRRYVVFILVCLLSVALFTPICNALPTGDTNGDGKVSAVDVLLALRIVVGLDQPTPQVLSRSDIGPTDSGGVPRPDGHITLEDAIFILQKSLSVPSWHIPSAVTVPNIAGQPPATAQATLYSSLLTVGTITTEYSATVPTGTIISQTPAAETSVAPGTTISMIVSGGLPVVNVPNVLGKTHIAAENAISSAGLTIGTVTFQHNATIASGFVIGQSPTAGNVVALDSRVDLVISSGPFSAEIPDVTGLTRAAAVDLLTAKGYKLGTVSTAHNTMIVSGNIITQQPMAGTVASPGASVAVVLSAGPAEASITVPNITGMSLADAKAAITEANLRIGNNFYDTNATTPSGKIISQYPAALTKAISGSAVSFVISSGPAPGVTIPPDPAAIAPDVNALPPLVNATEFIYTGSPPIQTGVLTGTIDSDRIAVLRGKVSDKNGLPLSGVNITVKDHLELGQTYSRGDGAFDLVVNGGGYLWVNYSKAGYLPSQRQIDVPVQDYAWLPDVTLLQPDSLVTTVDLTSPLPMQVARGSVVTDTDGSRQATLLISAGTSAEMTLPDGDTVPTTTLNIRATEYTVGDNGPKAMPGQLPPTTAYTYAVEFSADEAIAVEATKISFDRPLYVYVDDFIGFPVGSAVPAGYYDRQKGSWIASENGRVVKILGITAGMADLDVDGTNSVASDSSLALLNITEAERRTLAALYPGTPKQLWRVPITHFTPWDCNWPYGPPQDAISPPLITNFIEDDVDDPCTENGSIIECQNRALGESIPIQGTAYSLNYRSNLTAGYLPSRKISITLTGASLPATLQRIDVELYIAGLRITRSFPALPNLVFDYSWDGRDCYGRVSRSAYYTVKVSYVYPAVFYPVRTDFQAAFGRVQGSSGILGFSENRSASTISLTKTRSGALSVNTVKPTPLPYWTLDVHHYYDPTKQVIYFGSGDHSELGQQPGGDVVEEIGEY